MAAMLLLGLRHALHHVPCTMQVASLQQELSAAHAQQRASDEERATMRAEHGAEVEALKAAHAQEANALQAAVHKGTEEVSVWGGCVVGKG